MSRWVGDGWVGIGRGSRGGRGEVGRGGEGVYSCHAWP